jgi:hypothetical protein
MLPYSTTVLESMSFAEEISMVAGNTLKSIKLITSSWR